MNRDVYFSVIEDKLNTLATRLKSRGKLNLLNLHSHSENFYQHFLKELYGWTVTNLNEVKHNIEAIDLIDHTNKYVIQVSATATKLKIESALSKELIKQYNTYTFKFISIAVDAGDLRKKTYKNPRSINFKPSTDIIDVNSILTKIKTLSPDDLIRIYNFIKKELGGDIDLIKLETNLATIINILSKENRDKKDIITDTNAFEIDRKIAFNNLFSAKSIITDYMIHYGRIDKIYTEFDTSGINKSSSVLSTIRKDYLKGKKHLTDDELFFNVIEKVQDKVMNSINYFPIPFDELELCINIFVVDAFIRCKIFENPNNYNYVTT